MSDLEKIIREGFERVDRRFDSVEVRLDGVEGRLDGVEGRLGRVERNLRKLDKDVNTKLDAVAFNLKAMEQSHGKRITDLEARVDNLENQANS